MENVRESRDLATQSVVAATFLLENSAISHDVPAQTHPVLGWTLWGSGPRTLAWALAVDTAKAASTSNASVENSASSRAAGTPAVATTAGAVPEFVNPKYADSSRTAFKSPTRLECMMQDLPWLLDADATTSEGVFVYCETSCPAPLAVGDQVTVSGVADEFFGMTQVNATGATDVVIDSSGNPLPTAVDVALPAGRARDRRRLASYRPRLAQETPRRSPRAKPILG